MTGKQGNPMQVLSSYAISLEQRLLHWTFAIFGASVGLLQGTYHAAQRLQPHFTSTKGAKQLIYGVNHPEREQLTVTDLIKSWIPGYTSTGQKAIGEPASQSKANGYALDHATAVQTDPKQTPEQSLTAKARDYTPRKMYHHYAESGPAVKQGGIAAADDAALAPGTRTHSYEPEIHHSAHSDDTEETEDDDHSVIGEGEDPNHHRKRKKAAQALKKAGHAIKTVFKMPIENSDRAHGGILPCTAPTATK